MTHELWGKHPTPVDFTFAHNLPGYPPPMVDDATFRSAVNNQRFLLFVFVVQIVAALMSSSFSTADKVVACIFWLGFAAHTCYQIFTPGGRARLRKQAKIGLPRTGLGLTLYWGVFVAMFAAVGVLLLVLGMPFWLLLLTSVPAGFAIHHVVKAITLWDARRFASSDFFFIPPPASNTGHSSKGPRSNS